MIYYDHSWQITGSVFPSAAKIALPSATVTLLLNLLTYLNIIPPVDWLGVEGSVFWDSSAWTGFSTLVGFLVVFRTSQAYSRFWDGCTATYMMQTEWFDACSSVISFCKHSKAGEDTVLGFQNLLIRLFSMLHALALAEIEDSSTEEESAAFNYELIDIEAIDTESLRTLKSSDCKVELVFQWIQQLLVENIETGVLAIPPPILSRAFQELATGMVQFHDALKISSIPFPFPYAQTCDFLLLLHSFGTPFVMCQWVSKPWWAFTLSFTQVFILWCLNYIAIEIQNPFGSDANDIDAASMQNQMNAQLLLLLSPGTKRTPRLKSKAMVRLAEPEKPENSGTLSLKMAMSKKSFSSVFEGIDEANGRRNSVEHLPIGNPVNASVAQRASQNSSQIAGESLFGNFGEDDMEEDGSEIEGEDAVGGIQRRMSNRVHQVCDLVDNSGGTGWHRTMRRIMEAQGVEPPALGRSGMMCETSTADFTGSQSTSMSITVSEGAFAGLPADIPDSSRGSSITSGSK